MHFCTAHIAIGGDTRNIMYRDEYAPISWPEMEVLRIIHGDASVTEIRPFVDVKQSASAERNRLVAIYGEAPLQERWGGKNAPTELTAPAAKLATNKVWINPISGLPENTGKDGKSSTPVPILTPTVSPTGNFVAPREVIGEVKFASPETQSSAEDQYYRDDVETPPETLETPQDEPIEVEPFISKTKTRK